MSNFFTYGTLKRGGALNHVLKGKFLRDVVTKPLYTLFDYRGAFPCLVETGFMAIHGELWEVEEAEYFTLDRVEGVSRGLYRRGWVRFPDDSTAVAYFYNGDTSRMPLAGDRW